MRDDRTEYLDLPLPHGQNTLEEDLPRLRDAFGILDDAAKAQSANMDSTILELRGNIAAVASALNDETARAEYAESALEQHIAGRVKLDEIGPWLPGLNYVAGRLVVDGDGYVHVSKLPSGPGTEAGPKDPANGENSDYWGNLKTGAPALAGEIAHKGYVDESIAAINTGTATKLATARSLKTNLASTTAVTFDGSADQDAIPVTGTLPIANGGTGATTAAAARTALAVAYSVSGCTNGYYKLPGGLILQWGYAGNASSGKTTITFPAAFPNYCFNAHGCGFQSDGVTKVTVTVHALSKTNFSFSGFWANDATADTNAQRIGIYWLAIGN